MFTVRDAFTADPAGTLAQVGATGFDGVELFDHSGVIPLAEQYPLVKGSGMQVIGGHIVLDTVKDEAALAATARQYASMGAKHLALAYLFPHERGGLESYRAVAKLCNRAGALARDAGLTFEYHNHEFEFQLVEDGRTGYDVLMAETDPALVQAELDLFWVQKAGLDPAAVLRRYSGRVPLVHVKDMTADDARTFEIVGAGCMDYDTILPAADAAGAEWFIVEQDQCPKGEMASMRASYANIVARGWR